MVEQIFQFIGAELFISHEIEKYPRVKIARARTHGNAAGGSEAHGGVDRFSVAKSAEACSVPEVREDRSLGKLRSKVMHQRLVGKP